VKKVYDQAVLFSSGQQLTSGEGIRLEFWRISLRMMGEKPILGWGTGGYNAEFERRAKEDNLTFVSAGTYNPHNQYLYIGTQLGSVGLLAFLVWLTLPIKWMRALDRPRRTLALGLVCTLAIHSMFDSPLFIVTEGHFYCAMLALLFANPRPRDGPASQSPA
jgi:O-antigen ligase